MFYSLHMKSKICTKCDNRKTIRDFAWKNKAKGKRSSWCKECHAAYARALYSRPEQKAKVAVRIRARNFRVREEHRNRLASLKHNKQCMDCEKPHPYWRMHYDHRDPAIKRDDVGRLVNNVVSFDIVLEEIEKCDLVCANCHADRTYERAVAAGKWKQRA